MTKGELKYLVALSVFSKFNPKSLLKIKRTFVNLQDVWQAGLHDFLKLGITESTALSFLEERNKINPEQEWEKVQQANLNIITLDDPGYPPLLKEISDPPVLLYYRGLLKNDAFPLAVVGSRRLSFYGRQVIEKLMPKLIDNKISIISGLALGADAVSHQECLKNHGRTIAVLGSGLDAANIYPKQNQRLAQEIFEAGGLIISEYPIGTLPLRFNFPARNRLISGLSLGTLIIEATEESGSLITAKLALEQNREVFCVPGNIFSPLSEGPNNLIKLGAKLITGVEDILEEMSIEHQELPLPKAKPLPANPQETAILKTLGPEPKHIDKITLESGLSASLVFSVISLMEIAGKVKNVGGMNYLICA